MKILQKKTIFRVKLAHGCFQTEKAVVCTAFPTLGFEGIKSIFNETESSILFISLEHLTTLFQLLEQQIKKKGIISETKTILQLFFENFPTLKHIIYLEEKFLDKEYQKEVDNNFRNGILKDLFLLPNLKNQETASSSDKTPHFFFSYDELFEIGSELKAKMDPKEYVPQWHEKTKRNPDETIVIM